MKLKDLLQQLSQYPEDTEVAIFDWRRSDVEDGNQINGAGVYMDFELILEPTAEVEGREHPACLMLGFDNIWIPEEESAMGAAVKFEIEAVVPTENPFDRLQTLQLDYGYKKGELNPVALLGLFGEAGEVLNEVGLFVGSGDLERVFTPVNEMEGLMANAISVADEIDAYKKRIRASGEPIIVFLVESDGQKFDIELGDLVYYANLCALGRGRTLQYYAELSYNKVKAKGLKAPETDGNT